MQYQFCRVCRHNHNQGKGHRLSTKHKLRVDALLKKFQKNIQEVKFFLKNAMRLRGDFGNRSKFWCNFCEQETSEDKSEFAWYFPFPVASPGKFLSLLVCLRVWKTFCTTFSPSFAAFSYARIFPLFT